MRKLFIVGALFLVVVLALALLTLRFIGFEPRDRSPGLWVSGEPRHHTHHRLVLHPSH